jgi:hypothetical protein
MGRCSVVHAHSSPSALWTMTNACPSAWGEEASAPGRANPRGALDQQATRGFTLRELRRVRFPFDPHFWAKAVEGASGGTYAILPLAAGTPRCEGAAELVPRSPYADARDSHRNGEHRCVCVRHPCSPGASTATDSLTVTLRARTRLSTSSRSADHQACARACDQPPASRQASKLWLSASALCGRRRGSFARQSRMI